jgi:hypothetical protein
MFTVRGRNRRHKLFFAVSTHLLGGSHDECLRARANILQIILLVCAFSDARYIAILADIVGAENFARTHLAASKCPR